MSTILLTGATGTVGTQTAELLLASGANVRIAARTPSKAPAGAEVVAFDWDRPETYGPAFAGVDRVFLLTPFVEDFVPYVERAVAAARAAGVRHIVRLSAIGADPDSDGVGRNHGLAERIVKDSGLGWTVLQPTFFADNALNFQGPAIRDGAFYGASAGKPISYVSSRDIAEVAVAALLDPGAHAGQTYVLTGPEAITDPQLAEVLSDVVGRPVQFVDLPADTFGEGLLAQQTPKWMVDHLVTYEQIKAQGWAAATTDSVERVLGRPATPASEGLSRYA